MNGYAPHETQPPVYPEPAPVIPQAKKKARSKGTRRSLVPRTHNGGTMTEAAFWGMLRSGLRRTFRFWVPIQNALRRARVPYVGPNKRQKWAFLCDECQKQFPRSGVEVHHVEECGELRAWEHVVPFIQRLAVEDPDGKALKVLCTSCHEKHHDS